MRFGGVTAVKDVNFSVAPGELRCLIGPNGAGKSTFFKMLSGMLRPTAGSITFAGKPIAGMQRHHIARAGIGIKTQVPNVFPAMSALQNIKVAARSNRSGAHVDDIAAKVIDTFMLAPIVGLPTSQLSHGQRQSVEIAMVVASGPKLILLDEPVAGLSDQETERMAEFIESLRSQVTMIVVDHDIRFIRRIGSRTTVFHRGSVLMEDDIEVVLADETVRDIYLGRMASHA